MAYPFLGQIMLCPYTYPPSGWADCAGQLLAVSQYSALFALLGTAYGGNGTSNFALPDLQGRAAVSQGQLAGGSSYVMGYKDGDEGVTLNASQMANHSHSLHANAAVASANAATGNMLARLGRLGAGGIYAVPPGTATTLSQASVGMAGGNASHNTMQPFLVLRYVISLQGRFPTRP